VVRRKSALAPPLADSRVIARIERENVVRVIPDGLQLMGSPERPLLIERCFALALQLLFISASESMGNHDSKIVDAGSVN
jgi:hypothetical protein